MFTFINLLQWQKNNQGRYQQGHNSNHHKDENNQHHYVLRNLNKIHRREKTVQCQVKEGRQLKHKYEIANDGC